MFQKTNNWLILSFDHANVKKFGSEREYSSNRRESQKGKTTNLH